MLESLAKHSPLPAAYVQLCGSKECEARELALVPQKLRQHELTRRSNGTMPTEVLAKPSPMIHNLRFTAKTEAPAHG